MYTPRFYGARNESKAALFKTLLQPSKDENLLDVCAASTSHCVLCHRRNAPQAAAINRESTHPFRNGRILFCHCGTVVQFDAVRRALISHIPDNIFQHVKGTTASELVFALFLSNLQQIESLGGSNAVADVEEDRPAALLGLSWDLSANITLDIPVPANGFQTIFSGGDPFSQRDVRASPHPPSS